MKNAIKKKHLHETKMVNNIYTVDWYWERNFRFNFYVNKIKKMSKDKIGGNRYNFLLHIRYGVNCLFYFLVSKFNVAAQNVFMFIFMCLEIILSKFQVTFFFLLVIFFWRCERKRSVYNYRFIYKRNQFTDELMIKDLFKNLVLFY